MVVDNVFFSYVQLQYSRLKDTMKTYDDKLKYHEEMKRKLKSQ